MRRAIFEQAQADLREYIIQRNLKPGDRLPPEAELADRLQVSRLSLREATRSLQSFGVIESRPGRGLYVAPFSLKALLEQLPYDLLTSRATLKDILEVRQALEEGLIIELSRRVTAKDLEELDQIVDEMEAEVAKPAPSASLDNRFHQRLFEPLGNFLVTELISLFWTVFHRLQDQLPIGDNHAVQVHRDLVDALRTGDGDQLIEAVRNHFVGAHEALDESAGTSETPETE